MDGEYAKPRTFCGARLDVSDGENSIKNCGCKSIRSFYLKLQSFGYDLRDLDARGGRLSKAAGYARAVADGEEV